MLINLKRSVFVTGLVNKFKTVGPATGLVDRLQTVRSVTGLVD